ERGLLLESGSVSGVGLVALPLALGENAQVVVGLGEGRIGLAHRLEPALEGSVIARAGLCLRLRRLGGVLEEQHRPAVGRRRSRAGGDRSDRCGRSLLRRGAGGAGNDQRQRGEEGTEREGRGAHWRTSSGSVSALDFFCCAEAGTTADAGASDGRCPGRRSLDSSCRALPPVAAGSRGTTGRPGGNPPAVPVSATPGTAGCTWVRSCGGGGWTPVSWRGFATSSSSGGYCAGR